MKHLESNRYFTNCQHGFPVGFSRTTQQNLAIVFSDHLTWANCQTVHFWIKKTFDSVPHALLLHSLPFLGLHQDVVQRKTGYLHNHTQCVLISGCKSGAVSFSSSVPQGTVLGPLLFLVYNNNIVSNLSCKVILYADYCVVYLGIKSSIDTGQPQQTFTIFKRGVQNGIWIYMLQNVSTFHSHAAPTPFYQNIL